MPNAKDTVPKTNVELNKLLCESKDRVPVWETISATVRQIPGAVSESSGGGSDSLYEAKLFHAGKINGNNRVYTAQVMEANVSRLQPMLKTGGFNGSVDHGTGLRNQVIMWKELHIDPDGSGMGKFAIVPGHTIGEDLRKQIEAGMSVGFSTWGYGTGHSPSEEECNTYGIPEELAGLKPEDGGAVVMDDNYELVKCDPVDDPSVHDARIKTPTLPTNVPGYGGYTGNNRSAMPVKESGGAKAEACSNGLHWIEKYWCGHVISQCKCECDDCERTVVWREGTCEKCQKEKTSLSVAEFKAKITESKKARVPVSEAKERKPLATHYTQYIQSKDGDSFEPVGKIKTVPKLEQEAYAIVATWGGVRFDRIAPQTDDLYRFPNSVMENVIAEIDKFWDLKPKFDQLGIMHNRGIIMEGPPGNGKTSALNQIVELIVGRGDVVFYADDVYTLKAGLDAFREVEPDRKVVVALEDADQYIGYQERAMLNLLDGAQSVSGVCYVATTNYIGRFPERLLRPGRFDKHVHVGPPPIEGRRVYLAKKLGGIEQAEEIERLARETDGLSFGHLRELITAVYALGEPVKDVLSRLKGKHKPGTQASSRLINQNESRVTNPAASEVTAQPSKESRGDQMDKALIEQFNKMIDAAKEVEGVNIPQREVLPAEFKEQLDKANGAIAERDAKLATLATEHEAKLAAVEAEKAELQKQIDASKAKEANADRIAKVNAKADALLKDNTFADLIRPRIADAVKAEAFAEGNVEDFIQSKTSEYDAVKNAKPKIDTSVSGSAIGGQELEDLEQENEETEPAEKTKVEPAAELQKMFGKKK